MRPSRLDPIRALLLGGAIALFLGSWFSDIAYSRSFELQWANFAAWLNAGALVFTGLLLLVALIDLVRHRERKGRGGLFLILVAVMFIVGFVNALIDARDGWRRCRPASCCRRS